MKNRSLNTLKVGETAIVQKLVASDSSDLNKSLKSINSGELIKKLLPLGFVAGSKIKVKSIAPLGCPMTISIKGFDVCLRKIEAMQVLVTG